MSTPAPTSPSLHPTRRQLDELDALVERMLELPVKPGDEEANRSIANCTVKKTITKGGYEDAETTQDVKADKQAQAEAREAGETRMTQEQQLERAIKKDPANISNYRELAELHQRNERFAEAEEVLTRAREVLAELESHHHLEARQRPPAPRGKRRAAFRPSFPLFPGTSRANYECGASLPARPCQRRLLRPPRPAPSQTLQRRSLLLMLIPLRSSHGPAGVSNLLGHGPLRSA